MANE
jgi:tyrosine aminotransferase